MQHGMPHYNRLNETQIMSLLFCFLIKRLRFDFIINFEIPLVVDRSVVVGNSSSSSEVLKRLVFQLVV